MFSYLQKIGLEPIVIKRPAIAYKLEGKKFYDTGKMRYNSMITGLIEAKGATFKKNRSVDFIVLGSFGGNPSGIISSIDKSKVRCYLEDDFLIMIGERRYYLEHPEQENFAYCHHDIYKPKNCLITKGKIGQLGKTTSLDNTDIESLLKQLKEEGYQVKETPDKWRWMRKFFMLNPSARQNKEMVKKVKITSPEEFQIMKKYGLSMGHLISHNVEQEFSDSIEHITIVDGSYRSSYTKVEKVFEKFSNLRILELQRIFNVKSLAFDIKKMQNLRELSIGKPGDSDYWNAHKLNKLPQNIFESKSLLKVYIYETEGLTLTEEERLKLKNTCVQNSYVAMSSKNKKDRDLALSVLIEHTLDPFDKTIPQKTTFVFGGKIKGWKAKALKEKLEDLGFQYAEDIKTTENGELIAVLGDKPSLSFVEKALGQNCTIALEGMFHNFLRDIKKQQAAESGVEKNEDMKENLGQLLSHQDKANVELGMSLLSSKEIREEIHAIDELTTEWLMLATLDDDIKIRNKSKAQLKKNADYEINNFLKNDWHGRKKKSEQETMEAFDKIILHPALDKKKVLAAFYNYFKDKGRYRTYGAHESREITTFAIKHGIASFLGDNVLESITRMNINVCDLQWDELQLFRNLEYLSITQGYYEKSKDLVMPKKQLEFPKLKTLRMKLFKINNNVGLDDLGDTFEKSTNLEEAELAYSGLKKFPKFVLKMPKLNSLSLAYNEIDDLPIELGDMQELQRLDLRGACHNDYIMEDALLEKIVALPKLVSLELPDFGDVNILKKIPTKNYFTLRIPKHKKDITLLTEQGRLRLKYY
ncbi:MAG: leucine-rich repeat domain-containing protein [Aureispira sp.]|nr:leucine-rich repeat domain-containing protein [Aureispira sp.]